MRVRSAARANFSGSSTKPGARTVTTHGIASSKATTSPARTSTRTASTSFASCLAASIPSPSSLRAKIGMKTALKAPSASRRRKKLGSLKATRKASAGNPCSERGGEQHITQKSENPADGRQSADRQETPCLGSSPSRTGHDIGCSNRPNRSVPGDVVVRAQRKSGDIAGARLRNDQDIVFAIATGSRFAVGNGDHRFPWKAPCPVPGRSRHPRAAPVRLRGHSNVTICRNCGRSRNCVVRERHGKRRDH